MDEVTDMDEMNSEEAVEEAVDQALAEGQPAGAASSDRGPTPGDVLRSLPSEAHQRGTRFVSAQAMQAKLFSVYDAAAAAEEALALVQQQLTLTLNRSYYEADEIESMAAQLDSLLRLESLDLSEEGLVSEG
jgi:hypothetical protein